MITTAPAAAANLLAGAATVDITPPLGGPLWGYAARHDAPSAGVRDRLLARAVVIDHAGEGIAIVSLDLGRPPIRSQTAAIRQTVVPKSVKHMFLVASHTHHGPVLELENWPDANNPYNRHLTNSLCELIEKARADCRPAKLSVTHRELPLNRNRQSRRDDAPVDRELTVIRLDAPDGVRIATLVNFAAHPTMLDSRLMEFSGDYVGVMARAVEADTKAPCLFLQGAGGDMSVKPPTGFSGPDAFGALLAREVLDLAAKCQPLADTPIIRGVREEFAFPCVVKVGDPFVKLTLGQAFFPGIVAFYEREYATGVRPEISVATIGSTLGLVGYSGEAFCGHALSLKRRARMEHLLVCGCCNDYQQYFPTIEAVAEGGYGTSPPVSLAEPGAGERMTDRALLHLFKLRGQLP